MESYYTLWFFSIFQIFHCTACVVIYFDHRKLMRVSVRLRLQHVVSRRPPATAEPLVQHCAACNVHLSLAIPPTPRFLLVYFSCFSATNFVTKRTLRRQWCLWRSYCAVKVKSTSLLKVIIILIFRHNSIIPINAIKLLNYLSYFRLRSWEQKPGRDAVPKFSGHSNIQLVSSGTNLSIFWEILTMKDSWQASHNQREAWHLGKRDVMGFCWPLCAFINYIYLLKSIDYFLLRSLEAFHSKLLDYLGDPRR